MSVFDYNDGLDITNGAFRISASQVSKFFDNTNVWYRENLLGEGKFEGNTATKLGTVVHGAIEMYVDNGEVDWDEIYRFINNITDPEIDIDHISMQVEPMVHAALDYVSRHMPQETEKFVFQEIIPGYGAGGSIDAIRGHTIMDWKTTSQKSPITRFSRSYWFQQMTYAWVLKQQGVTINHLKLVYITNNEVGRVSEKTGKPLKDYPSQVYEVTEQVTEESLDIIENALKLVAESAKTFQERPELRHLLAQDMRLKVKEPPRLFK